MLSQKVYIDAICARFHLQVAIILILGIVLSNWSTFYSVVLASWTTRIAILLDLIILAILGHLEL